MKTKIVYSEKCLEYGSINAIENASRVLEAAKILKKRSYEFVEPQSATDDDLLLAHDAKYVAAVKSGTVSDPDTPAYENIYEYAKLSVGGAIAAAGTGGFSLMRPPGHHAGISGKALGASTRGFCYFNNIAIAVRKLCKKTVIIDIDGHHGNGTQEIFQNDPRVTYISLHRRNVFPQTGSISCGNYRNYPLEADCGAKIHSDTFKKALAEAKKELAAAELIAVSAGFDTHSGDIVSLGLETRDYFETGRQIATIGKPTFFVFEGGYNGKNVGNDIDSFLRGFES
jgi:acetoin utilization deacetylase AcuC-like enzyme